MSPQPIDPLRMRIFSELNIQLGHHGIEKEAMHIAASLNIDPLAVSVPIVDVPLGSREDYRDVAMAHKICLVVHSDSPSCPPSTALGPKSTTLKTETPSKAPSASNDKLAKPAAPNVNAGKVKILIERKSTLGHRKCLINLFTRVAGRVVEGILSGEENTMRTAEGSDGKGPLWDAKPWGEYC